MASPLQALTAAKRADRLAELASEARRLAVPQEHFVSHLSSNLDSLAGGLEQRPYGMSFARLPHERMSSPVASEPSGRVGVVFARVGGTGLDYSRPAHRNAIDAALLAAVENGGTAEDAYSALRGSGVQWVNNWNGIGESPELYALDPSAARISRVFESPRASAYRFPRPDSELGIVVNGDWRRAATAGVGAPEVRGK